MCFFLLIPDIIQMGFAAGYGMAGMSVTQLFFVCELGENIQVQKN